MRVEIYRFFIEECRAPMAAEIATRVNEPVSAVIGSLRELHETDVIALTPGTSLIWLAHPFSAQDSPFEVEAEGRRWDAICIWDALGVLAVLGKDGSVQTTCPDCGEKLLVEVRDGDVSADFPAMVHYGVPARRWYEDVGYT